MWPELPTSGFISGRSATPDDVSAGNAAFVLEYEGVPVGEPLAIEIPQYAYHIDERTGKRTPGVIIQAEEAEGNKIVAMRTFDGIEMAGLLGEYELLGKKAPQD